MALQKIVGVDISPGKEVVAMTCQLTLNWKSFAALGATVIGAILAWKLTPDQSERVLTKAVDTVEAVIISRNND